MNKTNLGNIIHPITDYHANGSYKILKENVTLKDDEDFALMIRTKNFEQNDFKNSNKYIDENAYHFLKKSKVLPGDIIMNKIANAGSVYLMPDLARPVSLAMNLFLIRPDEKKVNSKYVYLFLKNNEKYVKSFAQGSVTLTITKAAVRNLEIDLPNRFIQDQIVEIFEIIESKIELNQKMNETLEQIAKTLFQSWFIDFDPVRAKVEKRSTGLSKEISDLFPDSFEDSELGQIPKGFKVGKLQEMAKYLNRGVSPTYVVNSGVYLVNQKCIRNGQIDFNLCKQSKEKSNMDERYLEKYDILLNSMGVGTLGRVAMFHKFDKKITADALVTIIKGDSVGSSFFIYYFLERMEKYLNTISVGSTGQTSLKKEDILDLQMIIPPKKLLDEFGSQLSLLAEKKYINTQESLILTDLRDTLLPKLISGELKVPEAENLIEEASI